MTTTYSICGHTRETIILDFNELSIAAYLLWVDDQGWGGKKTLCWDCCCSESNGGTQ